MVAFPGAESRYALCNCDHHGYAHLSRRTPYPGRGERVLEFLAPDDQWRRSERGVELGMGPCSFSWCPCVRPVYIATNVNPPAAPAPSPMPSIGTLAGVALAVLLGGAVWVGSLHGMSVWASSAFVLGAYGLGWFGTMWAFWFGTHLERQKPR